MKLKVNHVKLFVCGAFSLVLLICLASAYSFGLVGDPRPVTDSLVDSPPSLLACGGDYGGYGDGYGGYDGFVATEATAAIMATEATTTIMMMAGIVATDATVGGTMVAVGGTEVLDFTVKSILVAH